VKTDKKIKIYKKILIYEIRNVRMNKKLRSKNKVEKEKVKYQGSPLTGLINKL